ncbi:hypothetical protein BDV97DRAFT_372868 [Delphinella strobiligena]|nr:hypothetical protein BDV97DRAFT_372868 [Delphinella strobiligena]
MPRRSSGGSWHGRRRVEGNLVQQTVAFLELPPEIRNLIYEHYFNPDPDPCGPYGLPPFEDEPESPSSYINYMWFPSLVATCTQVMREILPMLLSRQETRCLNMQYQKWGKQSKKPGRKHIIGENTRKWFMRASAAGVLRFPALSICLDACCEEICDPGCFHHRDFAVDIKNCDGVGKVEVTAIEPPRVECRLDHDKFLDHHKPIEKVRARLMEALEMRLKDREDKTFGWADMEAIVDFFNPYYPEESKMRL